MESKKKKSKLRYCTAFKLEVISQVLYGTYAKELAAKVYKTCANISQFK